ncbi:MAG: SMP-30/gluconolactonase/LRE family protein, partial [Verrucomicrobiota bacterium]
AVICFDPRSGEILDKIELPVTGPTSCTFGGPDLKTLFITTGKFPNVEEENAGRLFVAEPGVKGTPAVAFAG